MAAATAALRFPKKAAAAREDMPVAVGLAHLQASVVTALAAGVEAAVQGRETAALAAAVVLAFMDKGPTEAAKLTRPGVTAAAVAAMPVMALIIVVAVIMAPLAAQAVLTAAAAAVAPTLMGQELLVPSASYGPALHGRSRQHQRDRFVPPLL